MKKSLIEFFRPDKKKITLALAFPILTPLLLLGDKLLIVILSGATFSEITEMILSSLQDYLSLLSSITIPLLIVVYIFQVLIFYPASCSLTSIYALFEKGQIKAFKKNKGTFILIFIGLSILNPLILWQGYSFKQSMDRVYHPTSMIQIVKIESYSPFNTPFFKEGDIIYRILIIPHKNAESRRDRVFLIRNSTEFYEALNEANINDSINVDTYRGRTAISTKENITDWGITVRDVKVK